MKYWCDIDLETPGFRSLCYAGVSPTEHLMKHWRDIDLENAWVSQPMLRGRLTNRAFNETLRRGSVATQ